MIQVDVEQFGGGSSAVKGGEGETIYGCSLLKGRAEKSDERVRGRGNLAFLTTHYFVPLFLFSKTPRTWRRVFFYACAPSFAQRAEKR